MKKRSVGTVAVSFGEGLQQLVHKRRTRKIITSILLLVTGLTPKMWLTGRKYVAKPGMQIANPMVYRFRF